MSEIPELAVKTAVISMTIPPLPFGSSVRIYRLFREIDPGKYCLITSGDPEQACGDPSCRLPGPTFKLPSEWRRLSEPRSKWMRPSVRWLNTWLTILQRARNIWRILMREQCEAVLCFSPSFEDMPAACLAARFAQCRFYPVMDDDYVYEWTDPFRRNFAAKAAKWVMRRADCMFAISDFCSDEFIRRYGVRSVVLRTPSPERPEPEGMNLIRQPPEPLRILFTGTVYHAGADAIRTVLQGLQLLQDIPARVHVYASQTDAQLRRFCLDGPLDLFPPVGSDRIACLQAESDILLLAMGFDSGFPEVVRTSCPTKLSDYLVSGRPILCVAPVDSFAACYLRENGAAAIVDSADPERVAAELRLLVRDELRRRALVRAAWNLARRDWSSEANIGVMLRILNENVSNG